jgi:isopenicillin N synthase-like dioxygenase
MTHAIVGSEKLNLPIVDIDGLYSHSAEARSAVALAIQAACLDKGFFYCIGHGVDTGLIESVFAESARFFACPASEKEAVSMSLSKANRGYEPLRGQTLEKGAPPDLKEGYYIGTNIDADDERALRYFNTGPNVWPAAMPEFEEVMTTYMAAMKALTSKLLEGIALSLDLEADYFRDFEKDPIATLRLLHYPAQEADPLPDEKGCGAHTDFGATTILLQDGVGGLQVWDHDKGVWLDAVPVPGAFIINLGDMMARWTNDRYRSTIHRVINASGRERYSVPFFFSGYPEHPISCIPSTLDEGKVARYATMTVDQHMRERYSTTYGKAFA